MEGARAQKKFIRENIDKMLKEMADYGTEIVPASEMDMQSFKDVLGDKVIQIYLEKHGGEVGAQWLKKIEEVVKANP
jgi:TRAP-type C4-dicarboxylate transport system substrate-binding protein